MADSLMTRFKNAWNVFASNASNSSANIGQSFYFRPDRPAIRPGNERSIAMSMYNRIALDVSSLNFKHARVDENNNFVSEIKSGLNECLNLEANLDQSYMAFIQDLVLSMLDEGCIAVVPVETSVSIQNANAYDILSMRVGKITQWYPQHVQVYLYDERTGKKEYVTVSKRNVAIVENPFYSIVNQPNSTMQRLIRKLNILDAIDEQSGAGKLDLIVQLPYVIKTENQKKQAEERRKSIENQLAGSKYGIAYTDGTEHITQLNRPIENNLMKQIEYLTSMLYSQFGITESIMDGTADEKTMLNYYDHTIEPIASAITVEFKRKFLSKTARTQMQSIVFFRDPFKLVPISNIADIADKFTRNEIMTSNEIRQIVGMKPSDDPSANELRNKNLNQPAEEVGKDYVEDNSNPYDEEEIQNE